MKILPFESSSNGNSTHIYTDKASILIDVGVSLKKIKEKTGRDTFDAIFISHDHSDHIKSAGAAGRRFKCPMYMHPWVKTTMGDKLKNCKVLDHLPGADIVVGDLQIKSFSTKHDAKYTYGYVFTDLTKNKKFVHVTDTGIITPLMVMHMKGADAYFMETDYDVKSLQDYEGYDDYLKERIASAFGHLSNDDAMAGLFNVGVDLTEFIIFGHLSSRTNSPELVKEAAYKTFPLYDKNKFYIAPLDKAVEL